MTVRLPTFSSMTELNFVVSAFPVNAADISCLSTSLVLAYGQFFFLFGVPWHAWMDDHDIAPGSFYFPGWAE